MCKRRRFFFLLFPLIAACALPAATQTNAPSHTYVPTNAPQDQAVLGAAPSAISQTPQDSVALPTTSAPVSAGDFDAQRAFASAQMLAVSIGKRAAGSDGGARAG